MFKHFQICSVSVRQQALAQREKEKALKEEEDRQNGILPPPVKKDIVIESEEPQQPDQNGGLLGIFKLFGKSKEQTS